MLRTWPQRIHIYFTTQNLISITIMISIGFTALSLLPCHSITFDFIEICSGNCECNRLQLFMQIIHKSAPWMPVGRKLQNVTFSKFYQKIKFIAPLLQRSETCYVCLRTYYLVLTKEQRTVPVESLNRKYF